MGFGSDAVQVLLRDTGEEWCAGDIVTNFMFRKQDTEEAIEAVRLIV